MYLIVSIGNDLYFIIYGGFYLIDRHLDSKIVEFHQLFLSNDSRWSGVIDLFDDNLANLFDYKSDDLYLAYQLFGPYFTNVFADNSIFKKLNDIVNRLNSVLLKYNENYTYANLFNFFTKINQKDLFNYIDINDSLFLPVSTVNDSYLSSYYIDISGHILSNNDDVSFYDLFDDLIHYVIDCYMDSINLLDLSIAILNSEFISHMVFALDSAMLATSNSLYFNTVKYNTIIQYKKVRQFDIIDMVKIMNSVGYTNQYGQLAMDPQDIDYMTNVNNVTYGDILNYVL